MTLTALGTVQVHVQVSFVLLVHSRSTSGARARGRAKAHGCDSARAVRGQQGHHPCAFSGLPPSSVLSCPASILVPHCRLAPSEGCSHHAPCRLNALDRFVSSFSSHPPPRRYLSHVTLRRPPALVLCLLRGLLPGYIPSILINCSFQQAHPLLSKSRLRSAATRA